MHFRYWYDDICEVNEIIFEGSKSDCNEMGFDFDILLQCTFT